MSHLPPKNSNILSFSARRKQRKGASTKEVSSLSSTLPPPPKIPSQQEQYETILSALYDMGGSLDRMEEKFDLLLRYLKAFVDKPSK